MFAGQLACEAFNLALKRIIKEERPPHLLGSKGYGMPSSHAQFSFFWAVAVSLFLLARHRPRTVLHSRGTSVGATRDRDSGTRTSGLLGLVTAADVERYAHQPWSLAERLFVSSAALLLAGMVAWSRVYLNYHTPKQVLAGCLAGTLSAIAWFGVTYVMRQAGLISLLLDTPPARWLRLRDLVVEEDLCQAGWEKWEERKSAAQSRKDR
ncbi:hypothetical protein VTK73DRAFT_393 [Phialemonium thermophilum]|uniref:Dolichyldiphosphatase n=1 Tax=Phialemonium thermophilum TaxID=223376 RepID=A0ABR3VVC4_9PEZI